MKKQSFKAGMLAAAGAILAAISRFVAIPLDGVFGIPAGQWTGAMLIAAVVMIVLALFVAVRHRTRSA